MPCLPQTETRRETEQSSSRDIFKRANRFLSRDREGEDGSPVPTRYFERGHPLPANHSPERKATIPFRNPDLGLPSYRRRSNNFSYEAMSGLSPQRYMSYSNFRRRDSQSRASPRSGRSTNVSSAEARGIVQFVPSPRFQPRTVTGRPTRPLDRLLGNALHHEDEIRWLHAQHLPREAQARINMESPLAPPTKEAPPRAPTDTAWILKSCIRISNQSRVRQSQISPKKGTAGRKNILMWKSMAITMNAANTVVTIAVVAVERAVAAILHTTAGISLQKEAIVMTKQAVAVKMVVATVILTALVPQRLIKITMNMV